MPLLSLFDRHAGLPRFRGCIRHSSPAWERTVGLGNCHLCEDGSCRWLLWNAVRVFDSEVVYNWQTMERYVSQRTDAQFRHSICPTRYLAEMAPRIAEFKRKHPG